jgi:hypothetical protein
MTIQASKTFNTEADFLSFTIKLIQFLSVDTEAIELTELTKGSNLTTEALYTFQVHFESQVNTSKFLKLFGLDEDYCLYDLSI